MMSMLNMDLIYMQDDSMAPKFKIGDRVMVEKSTQITNGDVGVFLIEGQGKICRTFYKNGDTFILKPLNKKHKIISIPTTIWKIICKIVGKVVGVFKKAMT